LADSGVCVTIFDGPTNFQQGCGGAEGTHCQLTVLRQEVYGESFSTGRPRSCAQGRNQTPHHCRSPCLRHRRDHSSYRHSCSHGSSRSSGNGSNSSTIGSGCGNSCGCRCSCRHWFRCRRGYCLGYCTRTWRLPLWKLLLLDRLA